MGILNWLGLEPKQLSRDDADVLRGITQSLDAMPEPEARYIGLLAFILSRVAHADLDIGEGEVRAMERLVSERAGVSPAQAGLIVQIAKSQNRLFGATQNFLATREFKALATREQRLALLDCLFVVAAGDGSISGVEEEEVRNISRELGLTDDEYLGVRSHYRLQRSVFAG